MIEAFELSTSVWVQLRIAVLRASRLQTAEAACAVSTRPA